MPFQLICRAFARYSRIAPSLGKLAMYLLVVQLKAIHFINGILSRIDAIKDDKSLSSGFDVLFGHNIDNVAIFGKDSAQCLYQCWDFDALFEIFDLSICQ